MKVIILKSGTYNDLNDRAKVCKPGDGLETRGWYGQSLIKSGYAALPGEVEPEVKGQGSVKPDRGQTEPTTESNPTDPPSTPSDPPPTDDNPPPVEPSSNEQPETDALTDPPSTSEDLDATTSARKLAAQHNIDLATVTGTGANGRITLGDVQAVIEAQGNA